MIYLLVSISIGGMTASHLLLKKGVLAVGRFPQGFSEVIPFFLKAYTNAYVIAAVLVALLAGMAWILAVARAQLSFIYPFMGLSFVLVALFSLIIFKEDITAVRWGGILVICLGVFLVSRS